MSVIFSYWSLHRKIYKLGEYIMGSIITIFYPTKNHNALECFLLYGLVSSLQQPREKVEGS